MDTKRNAIGDVATETTKKTAVGSILASMSFHETQRWETSVERNVSTIQHQIRAKAWCGLLCRVSRIASTSEVH